MTNYEAMCQDKNKAGWIMIQYCIDTLKKMQFPDVTDYLDAEYKEVLHK